ncbi:MAG: glycosyltransferase family 4 protein [Daejeonella sp.]|uniref:glycosyltransferase family 4 protein n=1 Tax=Daejeonella sp. TaxID=2805397 RepID=UPI002732D62C|nr:glycosyltransferase family 4 protein [Daejeonella sp.]MDP3467496.1 glycosyltransferase family 4 protein [Daejeonella sp.]
MKQKPTFHTIFTDTENFHLVKDVGQIPYFMYKTEGYDAELISYRNNEAYPYINKEVKGLKLRFIPDKGRLFYFELGIVSYLWSFAKSIDVLNLFHFKKDHLLYLLLYKILNPKGKAYIKLDMDILFFKDYNAFLYSRYSVKNYLLKGITKWMFKLTHVFSVETEEARSYLIKVYPELEQKLICIPNGVDNLYLDEEIKLKPWEEKEDIIITVGRIGTLQKNTELFLEALKITKLNNWKVYILGPVEEDFQNYIKQYFLENPQLKNSIIFTGNVTDRKELFEWYNRAKIFCLTSRFEGFPIAFPEALYFGDYIISTPVSSSVHITNNGQFGKVVKADTPDFAAAIIECIADGFLTSEQFENTIKFSRANFTWPGIAKKLSEKLKENA